MNEKAERYAKLAKKNLDKIVVGILFLMLGILVFLYYQEQTSTAGSAGGGNPAKLSDPVKENPYWAGISAMSAPKDMTGYPAIEQIRKFNMFEVKNVKSREEIERRADQKFALAQDAAKKGQGPEAKRLLKEILAEFPNHRKARDLNSQLDPAEGSAAATTQTATAAPINT